MNIKTAYNRMTSKEFVDWALKNNYPYFLKIGYDMENKCNMESGWVWSKGNNPRQYKFKHRT